MRKSYAGKSCAIIRHVRIRGQLVTWMERKPSSLHREHEVIFAVMIVVGLEPQAVAVMRKKPS